MTWRGETTILDRIFACLSYALPISGALIFAGAFSELIPILNPVLLPFVTVGLVYSRLVGVLPFGDLIAFLALYFLVVRNESIRHFVRFHVMQALLLAIAISLVKILLDLLGLSSSLFLGLAGAGGIVVQAIFAALFVLFAGCALYSIFCAVQGKYADIPWISPAAYAQVP
jgi:uncharacterized membrane protein